MMQAASTWLIVLGGNWYYALAGAALLASGIYLGRGDVRGAWIYIGAYIVTAFWAFCESGLNGWALVPRIVAPSVFLVWLLAVTPGLEPQDRKLRGRGFMVFAAFVVVLGIAIAVTNRSPVLSSVPDPQAGINLDTNTPADAD